MLICYSDHAQAIAMEEEEVGADQCEYSKSV